MDNSINFFLQFCLTVWQFRFILFTLLVLILLGGVIFAKAEKMSLRTGIYFALQTALTLGFGDVTGKTRLGRVITLVIGFLGLILFGIIVAKGYLCPPAHARALQESPRLKMILPWNLIVCLCCCSFF